MSRAIRETAEACARARLPLARWAVAVAIASYANRDGEAWPGVRTIAELTGLNVGTVVRAIPDLEAAGIITVTRRDGRANRYRLAVTTPPVAVVDYPQPRASEARGTEHLSARVARASEARGPRASEARGSTTKEVEEVGHAWPCCCDGCVAAIEAKAR